MTGQPTPQRDPFIKKACAFLMKGYWQPILVCLLLTVFSVMVFPVLQWLIVSIMALRVLRNGPIDGLVIGIVTLAVAILLFLTQNLPGMIMIWSVMFGLTWIGACFLYYVPNWSLLIKYFMFVGVVLTIVVTLLFPNAGDSFYSLMEEYVVQVQEQYPDADEAGIDTVEILKQAEEDKLIIVGVNIAVSFLMVFFILMIGRWMQAMLYNPGGLREELHFIRMDIYALLLLCTVFLSVMLFGNALPWLQGLVYPVLFGFLLTGMSILHYLVYNKIRATRYRVLALLSSYLLFPMTFSIVFIVAILDVAFDFRKRIEARSAP